MRRLLCILFVLLFMTGCNKKVDVENPESNNQVVEQEDTNSADIVDNVEIKRLDNKTFEFVCKYGILKKNKMKL